MHVPINVKSPHNSSKCQMGFNSAFEGLMKKMRLVADWSSIQLDMLARYFRLFYVTRNVIIVPTMSRHWYHILILLNPDNAHIKMNLRYILVIF
jgi:hypothetical protein